MSRLLREAEKELAAAQRQLDKATSALDDAAARNDHVELASLGTRVADASSAVASIEERWLTLAEEAEQARS